MKALIEYIVKKRNPDFHFDPELNSGAIMQFLWIQFWSIIRGLCLLFLFKKPKGAIIGRRVKFFNISRIHFGKYLKLGDGVLISAVGKEGVLMGNNVSIGAYSRVIVSTSFNDLGKFIRIGNNVGIGEYAYLGGTGGLEIADNCIIGQYLSCHPENHNYENIDELIKDQGVNKKGIKIGPNCWIGSKVTILDSVEIGQGSIIAAGSVVNKSFPENSIIGGVPAKLLKTRNHES